MFNFLPLIIAFALESAPLKEKTIFPNSLNWNSVCASIAGEIQIVDNEKQFIDLFGNQSVLITKGEIERTFDCPVEAAFWIFKNELSTSSHFGDTELKKAIKSQIK